LLVHAPWASRSGESPVALLSTLEDARLIKRTVSTKDRRKRVVALTAKGRRLLNEIERRSNKRVLALVGNLEPADLERLVDAMATIGNLITKKKSNRQRPL